MMSDYNADPNPDLDLAHRIAHVYALAPQTKVKIDQFSTGTAYKVLTCNRRVGSTRLKFLVNPAIFS